MSSAGQQGSGGDEGSSATRPPKWERLGSVVENKTTLLARSLELLKTIIGPGYTDWRDVPHELKMAIWGALQVVLLLTFTFIFKYN